MEIIITVPFIILALIILLGILSIPAFKANAEEYKRTGKHHQGYYMGIGIAIGIPLGIPIGIAVDNIALGPAFGLPLGVAIGAALEKKHANELRPMTQKEKETKKRMTIIAGIILLIGIVALATVFYASQI